MWQNYFSIAVQLGEVNEALHALQVALEIAGREMKLEAASIHRFVRCCIQHLSSPLALHEGPTTNTNKHNPLPLSKALDCPPQSTDICCPVRFSEHENPTTIASHYPETSESGEGNLMPFLADVQLEEVTKVQGSLKQPTDPAVLASAQRGVRIRFIKRLRELFEKIFRSFVQDCELYAAAATLFGFLDGPRVGILYCLKEFRSAQCDQWARHEEKFSRVVEALQHFDEFVEVIEQFSGSNTEENDKPISSYQLLPRDCRVDIVDASESVISPCSIGCMPVEESSMSIPRTRREAALLLSQHCNFVLQQTSENISTEHPKYRALQILWKKQNAALHLK